MLWVSTFVLVPVWAGWAFLPLGALRALGVSYHPDRWWAVSLPAWASLTVAALPLLYHFWNMAHTIELDHINTIRDAWTDRQQAQAREKQQQQQQQHGHEDSTTTTAEEYERYSIPDCVDIPLRTVNQRLHRSDRTRASAQR